MANLFLEEITYITEAELKDSTRITDTTLVWTWDNEINNRTILIRKAEVIIDSIIWSYGTKVDPLQETIFPTVENSIPVAIKKAVVLLCEAMFSWGELEASNQFSWAKFIKSETHWDHKVEFQQETVQTNSMSKKNQYVNQEIEMLLKPFVLVTSWVKWSKSA